MNLRVTIFLIFTFFFSVLSFSQESEIESTVQSDTLENEETFLIVEQMPTFKGGGVEKFRSFINRNMKYPAKAAKKGIQGKVYVQFVINERGEMSDVHIARSAHPILDAEALRVIKTSPNWKPGYQKGKTVSVQFTFPIIFKLD